MKKRKYGEKRIKKIQKNILKSFSLFYLGFFTFSFRSSFGIKSLGDGFFYCELLNIQLRLKRCSSIWNILTNMQIVYCTFSYQQFQANWHINESKSFNFEFIHKTTQSIRLNFFFFSFPFKEPFLNSKCIYLFDFCQFFSPPVSKERRKRMFCDRFF